MPPTGVLTKHKSRKASDSAYRRSALTPPGGRNSGGVHETAPAVGTAGNDSSHTLGRVGADGIVVGATYTPDATITGAATNNRRIRVINKKQDGTGTTIVAELQFGNGTNAPASDETAITLSATLANLQVKAGDVLAFESTHIGTGITDPGGYVAINVASS